MEEHDFYGDPPKTEKEIEWVATSSQKLDNY